MIELCCFFESTDDAEFAKAKILHRCGGECDIISNCKASAETETIYQLPSPLTENGMWQMITPILPEKPEKTGSKCKLTYIGFESQAKEAEALLINLGGSDIEKSSFPHV